MAEYIEKRAVIMALETHWNGMVLDVFDFIRNLPSADVQPKDEVTKAFSDGYEAGYKRGYERGKEDGIHVE